MLGIATLVGGDGGSPPWVVVAFGARPFDVVIDASDVVPGCETDEGSSSVPLAADDGRGADRCARIAMPTSVTPAIARTNAITVAARSDDRDRTD